MFFTIYNDEQKLYPIQSKIKKIDFKNNFLILFHKYSHYIIDCILIFDCFEDDKLIRYQNHLMGSYKFYKSRVKNSKKKTSKIKIQENIINKIQKG